MPESFPLVFVYVKIYIPYMQDTYLFDTLFIKLYFLCTLELHVDALGEVVLCVRRGQSLVSWSCRGSHLLRKHLYVT